MTRCTHYFSHCYPERPGKAVYTQLLTKLKTSMADLQQISNNNNLHGLRTAKNCLPRNYVKGCFFHCPQSIWRKTQHTDLQVTYRNNEDIRQLVRRATYLPLVPMDLIEDVWFNALNDLEDIDTPANTTTFTDYVTIQWIDGD